MPRRVQLEPRAQEDVPPGLVARRCERCLAKLNPRPSKARGGGRYCSKKCYGKAIAGQRRPRTSALVRCEWCGAETLRYASAIAKATKHYCSRQCQQAARTGVNNPNWQGAKVRRSCPQCLTIFTAWSSTIEAGEGIYCSRVCANNAHKIYSDSKIARREHRRRREARERMARKDGRTHTLEQWEDLKRRAKYRCVKCKKMKPLVRDHIIPLSRGGSDHITNIQPLCAFCNNSKHAKIENLL